MSNNSSPPPSVPAARALPNGASRWWDLMPPLLIDAVVAATTAGAAIALLTISDEADRQAPDVVGYLLLVSAAMPYLLRRRWPAGAVMATLAIALAYLSLTYPGGPVTVPVLVALYGTAAQGHRVPALFVGGFFVIVGSTHRLVLQQEPIITVAFQSLLYVSAGLLGELVSSQRTLRAEAAARLRRAAEEREREAARRVQEERLRIARELHDILGHTVTSMTVQAGAAADLFDDQPDHAREALAVIRRNGRDAMAELRATLNLLRTGDDGRRRGPAPRLADLDGLIDSIKRDGLSVEQVTEGKPRPLPAAVELTGYRIVQEALTNVLRHAAAHRAVVTLWYQPDDLEIEIADDGLGGNHVHSGYGLLGMRERAEAVGGWLEAGPDKDRGFRVRARLPTGQRVR